MKPELLLRTLFAVFAIPITLFIVSNGGPVLQIFLLLFLAGAGVEYYNMLKHKEIKIFLPSMFMGILAFALTFGGLFGALDKDIAEIFFGVLFLTTFFIIAYEVYVADPDSIFQRAGATALGILYIGGLGTFMMLIPGLPHPEKFLGKLQMHGSPLILLLLAIWSSDSLAYFMGKYFGKKLLLPKASPKKTLMGLWGSMLGGAFGMIIGRSFLNFYNLDPLWAVVIGLMLGFFGQVGDLFESLLKRSCGVKDSSKIFPGHGGILDRIDALLFCAPIYYYMMRLCT
ncbi:MAG: phosphatidate cytidylyltransferase [Fibrobacteres bacterium]|nr:phosphatidate cytidylyltransferase [Fibrobacterota bacterium]